MKLYLDQNGGITGRKPTPAEPEAPEKDPYEGVIDGLHDIREAIIDTATVDKLDAIAMHMELYSVAIAKMLDGSRKQQEQVLTALENMTDALTRPKKIIRDEDGKPKGIE